MGIRTYAYVITNLCQELSVIHLPPSMVSSLPASSQNLISAYVIGPLLDWVPQKETWRQSLASRYALGMNTYKGSIKEQE